MTQIQGTIVSIRSVLCHVDSGGRLYTCKARRRLVDSDTAESKPLAVGDHVVITPIEGDEAVVEKVLPRTSWLSRSAPRDSRSEHVIVANVDQLLIVASARRPPLSLGIIDRYIIAGEAGCMDPVICINKIDLAHDESEYVDVARLYRQMDYTVLPTSATRGIGIEELRDVLRGRTTVLAGHSGVGKSALLNAVQPGLKLKTGDLYVKGRHTTAWVELLKLDIGGYVVDTPGIREFAPWDIKKVEVAQFFPQIWELSHECRMPDCLHTHEPGCAVMEALESGELPAARYDSYARIVETIEEETIPRATDVDEPEEQIHRKKREPSRRKRKQTLRRLLDELEEEEDEEDGGQF
jgi:ribosome biogenesis GTPase